MEQPNRTHCEETSERQTAAPSDIFATSSARTRGILSNRAAVSRLFRGTLTLFFMVTAAHAAGHGGDLDPIREYFGGLAKAPRCFSATFTCTKYPVDESSFPGGDIKNTLRGPNAGNDIVEQWVKELRSSNERDITLDVLQERFISHEILYSVDEHGVRKDKMQNNATAFDGESIRYYFPDGGHGTISTKNSPIRPANPFEIYLKSAAILGDSTRYVLANVEIALPANVPSLPRGKVIVIEDMAPESSGTMHQFVVDEIQGTILQHREYKVDSDDGAELSAMTEFAEFITFTTADDIAISVPGTVGQFETPMSIAEHPYNWGKRMQYRLEMITPAPDDPEHYKYEFPQGTKVWIKELAQSYVVGKGGAKLPVIDVPDLSVPSWDALEELVETLPEAAAVTQAESTVVAPASSDPSESHGKSPFVYVATILLTLVGAGALIVFVWRGRRGREGNAEK